MYQSKPKQSISAQVRTCWPLTSTVWRRWRPPVPWKWGEGLWMQGRTSNVQSGRGSTCAGSAAGRLAMSRWGFIQRVFCVCACKHKSFMLTIWVLLSIEQWIHLIYVGLKCKNTNIMWASTNIYILRFFWILSCTLYQINKHKISRKHLLVIYSKANIKISKLTL